MFSLSRWIQIPYSWPNPTLQILSLTTVLQLRESLRAQRLDQLYVLTLEALPLGRRVHLPAFLREEEEEGGQLLLQRPSDGPRTRVHRGSRSRSASRSKPRFPRLGGPVLKPNLSLIHAMKCGIFINYENII